MKGVRIRFRSFQIIFGVALSALAFSAPLRAQTTSLSAWDAADFRIWGFVPYWASQSQINAFATDGTYDHVSDVIYFSGVKPMANGGLSYHANANGHLAALKSHAAQFGFRYHMSMFDTAGGSVETVWNSITSNANTRATFVSNVKNFLQANSMTGFNLDWERPDTVAEWANYTQLAKDLRAQLNPLGMEISVDDYGYASSLWDDSAVFDAAAYDQLFIMGYHYGASSNNTFANTKLNLTGQGAAKAFKNEQLVLGIGTWGDNGPATVSLKNIVAVNPNLPADALTFTGTVNDINGVSRTATWDIESRYQVRDKVQLALNRGMQGVMSWTLHYDATNKLSLHRVAQHYAMFKRGIPDLNLNGQVDAADANALADHMGTVPGWKGTATAAQFENFYMSGNWEKGDRDGNGFVNQQDADWLAGRYGALGVALPDRLAYSGSFEKLPNGVGLNGRWQAARNGANQLIETGNFAQHHPGTLTFSGTGQGAGKHSMSTVTIRNQNSAEAFDSLNMQARAMRADLETPIDLSQEGKTYITFLVRQNTASLLPSQVASPNRTLSLELLDDAGQSQFDFAFFGQQTDFAIRSQADVAGDDVTTDGFAADATYLFVGKIAGNGADASMLQASLFADGAAVGNFTDPNFQWALTASGSEGFNPLLTQLQFTSLYEGNFTVSNVWIGGESDFFAPPMPGDFNADGSVDADDLSRWSANFGMNDSATHWQGDADGDKDVDGADFLLWQQHLGTITASPASAAVPEPASVLLALCGMMAALALRRPTGR